MILEIIKFGTNYNRYLNCSFDEYGIRRKVKRWFGGYRYEYYYDSDKKWIKTSDKKAFKNDGSITGAIKYQLKDAQTIFDNLIRLGEQKEIRHNFEVVKTNQSELNEEKLKKALDIK